MKCPKHNMTMDEVNTRYGIRYGCPIVGCTVAAWKDSGATPADYETRQARILAHHVFDHLWMSGQYKRNLLYDRLAAFMGLSAHCTHIRFFDKEQCKQVVRFVESEVIDSGNA